MHASVLLKVSTVKLCHCSRTIYFGNVEVAGCCIRVLPQFEIEQKYTVRRNLAQNYRLYKAQLDCAIHISSFSVDIL